MNTKTTARQIVDARETKPWAITFGETTYVATPEFLPRPDGEPDDAIFRITIAGARGSREAAACIPGVTSHSSRRLRARVRELVARYERLSGTSANWAVYYHAGWI